MSKIVKLGLIVVFFLNIHPLSAQLKNQPNPEYDSIIQKRIRKLSIAGTGLYVGSMFGLYNLWYKDYPHSAFHFLNDNDAWLQMDKAGHAFSAYYEGVCGYNLLRWANVPHKKAILYGASWGFLLQTPIEIFDGFSAQWGFSWGDLLANTAGSALVMGQEYFWEEQKIQFKFSFYPTDYPQMLGKNHLLGTNIVEQLIKDYNGQTYWLSTGINTILPKKTIPAWLNIALGYSADGMLRGTAFDQEHDPTIPIIKRQRYFYLAPDINIAKIPTDSKTLRTLFKVISFIKVPAPAIGYGTESGWKVYYLYF